jgi:hypothetical protein
VRGSIKERDSGGGDGVTSNRSSEKGLEKALQQAAATAVAQNAVEKLPLIQSIPMIPLPKFDGVFDDLDDGLQLSTLFAKKSIVALHSQTLPFHSVDVWRSLWMEADGYG